MKLSTRAEYGTRALVELALSYREDRPMMLQTIADRQGISKKYLEQLFILLRKAEIVEGVRGPTGGYRLARPPEDIRMAEVVEVLEGSLAVADCLVDQDACAKSGSCATQQIWAKVTEAIEGVLGAISLAELINRHSCMTDHLQFFPSIGGESFRCSSRESAKKDG